MLLLEIVLLLILLACFRYLIKLISIAAAYKAKLLCSGVFISNRSPESIIQEDLSVEDLKYFKPITAQVDFANQLATASLFGFGRRTAVYDSELGCTLVYENQPSLTRPLPNPTLLGERVVQTVTDRLPKTIVAEPYFGLETRLLPDRPRLLEEVKLTALDPVLDWAFTEPDPKHQRRTRAVVILLDGQIVAERYAAGFDQDMPLPGWSMAKSVVNALVGILVGQGKLNLDVPAPVPEWQGVGDLRREITLGQLMWMTSGLEFNEKSSNPVYDLTKMLLSTPDAAAYAASKPLRAKPGSSWRYASGNTNIVCRIIREALGEEAYRQFPRQALFEPLSMESAWFEMDASGTLVGSSFLYATARDWAKFGQLYCQDGLWEGKRILPEGWVNYSTVPCTPDRRYGAHFWLDIPQKKNEPDTAKPLPADAFHAMGYEGQCVSIIPSRKLVVVRLGLTRKTSAWRQDHFLNLILDCLSSLT
jgi:CubicO group peptidase (beta-lactamase class C family)